MGDIADMFADGTLDSETRELIDGRSPGYPRGSSLEEFTREVEASGLKVRVCSRWHWQILGGVAIVNVWPTSRKVHVDRTPGPAKVVAHILDAIDFAQGERQ